MADFGKLILTTKGKEALLSALNGKELKFTKIAMGSGTGSGDYASLTDLVKKNASVDITNATVDSEQGTVTVEAYFTNEVIKECFTWTEVGLYFESDDGSDILYAAAYTANGDYIPATTDSRFAKHLRITTAVGNTENISINIPDVVYVDTTTFFKHINDMENSHNHSFVSHDQSNAKFRIGLHGEGQFYVQNVSYAENEDGDISDNKKWYMASKEVVDNHIADTANPHKVDKEQVGLGNVPNVATNDQTPTHTMATTLMKLTSGEKLSVAMGKIAKAISALFDHLNNTENPHGVLWSQIGAASADHTHPEQDAINGVFTEGTGEAYTATVKNIRLLRHGASFIMIPHTTSTTVAPTLNVNGLGAVKIRRRLSSNTASTTVGPSENWLTIYCPIRVTYDGEYWIADITQPNSADLYGTLPIKSGGTGATTASQARANLGAVSMLTATVTLASSGWEDNKQSVLVEGVTDDVKFILPTNAPESYSDYTDNRVRYTGEMLYATGGRWLEFACDTKPTVDIKVNVAIFT